jgi:predicted Ser/Thr protein kinase
MSDSTDFDSDLRAALGDAYDVERELTGSGMSRVFVATERSLNRKVVVKVLPPELAAGVNRERFRREIQLAAQLQHPHIVPLLMAGAKDDLLFFTMPYIEGESLRHAIQEREKFSLREVVRILHDVSDALAYAHERGVIHRDIKPGNVLRSGSHAVVTDFGVAKAISAAMPAVGMTTSGMAIGTPAYMAPEQLAGDPAADHRVDIYALGLLAYELLTGDAPFKSASPQETMAAQLTRAPEPITRHREDVPPALAALIFRCLAKNPNDRPQSAREVAGILDEMEVTSGSTLPYRVSSGRRMRVVVGFTGLAALVALVAIWRGAHRAPGAAPVSAPRAESVPAGSTAAAPLTHDDSLAIARAVEKKLAEQQPVVRAKAESTQKAQARSGSKKAAPAQPADIAQQVARIADSLRIAIQHAVLDSVARERRLPNVPGVVRLQLNFDSLNRLGRAFGPGTPEAARQPRRDVFSREAFAERLANMGPPRRLFVSYPTLRRSQAGYAPMLDSLVDSLRRSLSRINRYVLIDADTVRATLARTRATNDIAAALNVDLFASLYMSPLPDSTVIWQVTVRDLAAHSAFSTRAITMHASRDSLLVRADSLIVQTIQTLRDVDRAPRKSNPVPGGDPR